MKKVIIISVLILLPIFAYSYRWEYITSPSKFNKVSKYVEDLKCISPDICYAYIGNGNLYKTSDQGKTWDSIYKFNNKPYHSFYPTLDTHYYVYYEDCFCEKHVYKKKIERITNGFNKVETMLYNDTSSKEVILYLPYMLDTKIGLIHSYEFVYDYSFEPSNINDYFLMTNDGWKTTMKRDIPLFFQKTRAYYTFSDGNILFHSGQSSTNIHHNDTIIRGGISAKYDFYEDKWTLLYEFPKKIIGDSTYYERGPTLIQMINDSVGFGYLSRQAAITIDSSLYNYDVFFRTKDGCKTWEKTMDTLRLSAIDDLQDFSFYDEKNGLMVGRNGKVLMTNDGGDSWYLEDPEEFSKSKLIAVMKVDWAGQFPIISTRLDGDIYRYEGDFFKFDFKSPDLFFPKNNLVGVTRNPLFRWEELRDATSYRFELSSDSDFKIKLWELGGDNLQMQYTGLEHFTEYWWRVSSTNGKETLWSAPAKFRTQMASTYATAPGCGEAEQEFKVNFAWVSVKGAENYKFRISSNPNFVDNSIEYKGITDTTFEVPDLEELTTYYWQVQPYRTDEEGTWSNVCNFKTKKSTSVRYSEDRGIRIRPNPTNDFITISLSDISPTLKHGVDESALKVQIFDMLGIEVAQTPSSVIITQTGMSELQRIDVSKLPTGVYFIRINCSNGACTVVEKFVKM